MESFKPILAKVAAGASLTRPEAEAAFDNLLSGEVTPAQMGAFLMALRVRGETVDEFTGATAAMRGKMLGVTAPEGAIDIVGTGGDGSGSYNVSTLASIIVASCGVPVAKHGNRALSSRSGASDVLGALGIGIGLKPAQIETSLREVGLGFMMAPTHHAAWRHVAPVRIELGTRTIFNILGPLCNPAAVKRQLVGAFSVDLLKPMAEVLRNLGSDNAWFVHGSDGLDEITTTGPTRVVALANGKIESFEVTPEDAGLARATSADLKGGDPEHNARALRDVLDGKASAYRDIALMNAAAALIVAGKAKELKEGVAIAAKVIADGRAKATLAKLAEVTNRPS
ncbi:MULTISPECIES: anthranilate phosphoribosyltransferase [unclassified Beijerinckia]|uniref:anthranilate phosphoribosyltransferase n=1 Tax=unclassified Beijerinckia TaxID=2638183 RepID=UPI000898CD9C|nr:MULTISPECIES: anthranilate phosphoribosyltransferase [unclassified Beijerinckia]MDH7794818.1 anthranilate phosphoribosyltransferase [Beijerinckia sp. GAS462]SEB76415.1 anthranilate phosphoribosyltransferase [Beijerinckia sp. 28-YEA-48]